MVNYCGVEWALRDGVYTRSTKKGVPWTMLFYAVTGRPNTFYLKVVEEGRIRGSEHSCASPEEAAAILMDH